MDFKENLTPVLSKADSWLSRFRGIVRALRSTKYLLLLFILALALDVVFQFSTQTRIQVLVVCAILVLLTAGLVIFRMFFQKEGIQKTARLIEDKDPELGSSLINTLQLTEKLNSEEMSDSSKALAAKAIDDYQKRIDFSKFKEVLNPGILGKELKKCLLAIAVAVAVCFIFSQIFKMHIVRYLDPYGDHPAFSLTSLEITSPVPNHTVLYSGDSIVNVKISGHHPGELFLSYFEEGKESLIQTVPMYKKGSEAFTQKLTKLKAPTVFFAHTRDKRSVSHKRKIGIIYTPQVEKAFVTVAPPAYTGRKERKLPFKWRNVTALKGSKVTYTLHSNRPLKSGIIEVIKGTEKSTVKMKAVEENTVSGTISVEDSVRLRFIVKDTDGNDSLELLKGSITVTYDRAPTVAITSPERNSFVTEDFVLKVRAQADDDYGVKELRIHRGLNGFYGPPAVVQPEETTLSTVDKILSITIKDLGVVPGDILEFYADTLDNSPDQQTAVSPIVYLKVISVQEYNDYLRKRAQITDITNKYEDLLERLHELRKEQEKINEEIAKLEEELKKGDKKNEKELRAQINKLIKKQNEINHKMNQLADDFDSFVRENPLFDIEKAFAEQLQEQAEELREEAEKNKEELEEFAEQSEKAMESNNQQSLLEAVQAFRMSTDRVAKKLRKEEEEYEEGIVQTLEDLEKMNQLVRDFNYFVFLYRMQDKLTKQLKPFDIVRDLSTRDKLSLKKFAATEKFIGDEIVKLIMSLRKHAEEAEDQFPKAAASANSLADKLEKARLEQLCKDAVNNMLLPDGPESYNMAEWIRREMQKMFNDSTPYDTPGQVSQSLKKEFDRYLQLMLEMPPGDCFSQMCQSANFGFGQGQGMGIGGVGGTGNGGSRSGYSTGGPNVGLLGNEMLNGNQNQPGGLQGGKGRSSASPSNNNSVISTNREKSNTKDSKGTKTKGETVSPEALMGEYENLIEAYFEKVTK